MNESSQPPVGPQESLGSAAVGSGASRPASPPSGNKGKQRAGDRLNIPSSIVRGSGFVPGDKVYVVDADPEVDRPCLVLLKQEPPKSLGDYGVAKDLRIRVTPAMLKKCGLDGESFEIDSGEGRIVVRPRL
jgi:hypothetical protein